MNINIQRLSDRPNIQHLTYHTLQLKENHDMERLEDEELLEILTFSQDMSQRAAARAEIKERAQLPTISSVIDYFGTSRHGYPIVEVIDPYPLPIYEIPFTDYYRIVVGD